MAYERLKKNLLGAASKTGKFIQDSANETVKREIKRAKKRKLSDPFGLY